MCPKSAWLACVVAVFYSRLRRLRAQRTMRRLYIHFWFAVAISGVSAASSSDCAPPTALQAKLQAQPTANTYAEEGTWYAEHHKYACAVQAYRSALQKDPNSAEFSYLLGLNLIRKSDVSGATQ